MNKAISYFVVGSMLMLIGIGMFYAPILLCRAMYNIYIAFQG